MKCLLCVFWLSVCIFSSSSYAKAVIPFDVDENLIYFAPNVLLNTGEECQGFRVAKTLLVTSPQCVMMLSQRSKEEQITILGANRVSLGVLSHGNDIEELNEVETDLLLAISDTAEDEVFLDTPIYVSDAIPEQSKAYYLDAGHNIISEPVTLSFPNSPDEEGFLKLQSSDKLPQGAPVFDTEGSLVCLVASRGRCRVLSPGLIYRSGNLTSEGSEHTYHPYLIAGVVVATVSAIVATASFYLILLARAKAQGMPVGRACRGLCCFEYFTKWDRLSTALCFTGIVINPFVAGLGSLPLWWAAAFNAGRSWVNNYNQVSIYSLSDPEASTSISMNAPYSHASPLLYGHK